MKFIVLLVLILVVAGLIRKALAGSPTSGDTRDNPRIPTAEQADTPSRTPDDEPRA